MPYKNQQDRIEASRRYRKRHRERLKAEREAKKETLNAKQKEAWKNMSPEKREEELVKRRSYYHKNKEAIREQQRLYYRSDPSRFAMYSRTRRGVQEKATPSWLTLEQRKYIRSLYRFARNVSGVNEYHVDHIVPLQAENICGLHVPWNLQVIPAKDNRSKGNKYESDWG